jgi:penicillin-binding protein 2
MQVAKRTFWIALIGLLVLSACGESVSGSLSSSSGLDPSPQLTLEEADQVAATFLTAWENTDYATMYSLISPNSRDAYNQDAFASAYEDAAVQMALISLDAEITSSLRQGTTAAIMYDVTFTSEVFSEIVDPARTMRLIETSEGWRVAWSRMDIFDDLAEGARLELKRTLPGRGNIYDRNGQVLVDQNGRSVALYVVQRDVPNIPDCITALSRILRQSYTDLEDKFSKFLPETLFLVGEVDPETYQAEEQILREICAIGDDANDTYVRTTRRYFGELASHVIGYVSQIRPEQLDEYERKGYPPDALIGQEGIELAYEQELAGEIGGRLVITAPTGEVLREIAEVPAAPGQSVYLTIDRDLQAAVQDAIIEAYNISGPTWARTSPGASAIVMNVNTGEILAMVSYPWFDPSLFNPDSPVQNRGEAIAALETDPRRPLFNRAMMGRFPAGSVFKIVSVSAGLDSGVYDLNRTTVCTGVWYGEQYGDGVPYRTDWLPTGHGAGINAKWGLTYSCDPFFWDLGVALHNADPQMLTKYAHMMGLGVPTGQEDLPEEIGQIPDEELVFRMDARSWNIADTLNMVIGQGQMQVTPLQITRMVAAVASGGSMLKPQFVSKIQLIGEEPTFVAQPTAISTLDFEPWIFDTIREAMCNVTLDINGTARYMFEEWYKFQGTDVIVCGKTGTAQTGGETTKPQAWFVAFAPQDDPEIAVVVMVENSCEGSEVAAPIVRRIVEDYYGMPHSEWPPLWQSGCIELGE